MTDVDPLSGLDQNTEWQYGGIKNGKALLIAVFASRPQGGLEFRVTREEVHYLIKRFGCNEALATAYNNLPAPVVFAKCTQSNP